MSNDEEFKFDPTKLSGGERFWRDHLSWLKSCGYTLRPRYSPDWKPSWLGTNKKFYECEDGQEPLVRSTLYRCDEFGRTLIASASSEPQSWMQLACQMGRW